MEPTRLCGGWWRCRKRPWGAPGAYYSGTAWTTTFDFMQADFQDVHGSVGWDGGLAVLYVPDPSNQQYLGAISTAAP
ncbi:MAG: hypothetical protein IPL39_24965 [Opitutaceae bacterium]|nr:hypothetical protein [Opitutaceae bacterium]